MVQIHSQTQPTLVSNTHTNKKVNLILSKCYFKAFPSTPSKPDFQHLNEVLKLTELKNKTKTSRERGQLFRGPSACTSYTALSRAGGQGNPSPVELVSAMLWAPPGSRGTGLPRCLQACFSHTSLGKERGLLFLASGHAR